MTTTFAGHLLGPDTHASRPAAGDVPAGTLYSCSEHGLIYQSDGTSWITWATVGGPGSPAELGVAATDETTAIASTGVQNTFRAPHAMTVTEVRASLTSAASSGTFTVDIREGGTTILSTLLTIDAGETTSTTAAAAAVIADADLADDAEVTVVVTDTADGTATGLKVWLIGTRA